MKSPREDISAMNEMTKMIELEPFGMAAGMDRVRPVMLFREKGGQAVLPVWLSPVDAGIALTQHNVQTSAMSPHDVTLNLIKALGVRLESCHFMEVKGHQQYVELGFSGSRKVKKMKARADHAVSFCLQARAKFLLFAGLSRAVSAGRRRDGASGYDPQNETGSRRGGHHYLN
ncbi:MAG: bifunctional nuclease family protein [Calothrix sp. SM1_5_4]|nr:bifunctional nuclease family protein [Calothrix sp. SM1_5_4]